MFIVQSLWQSMREKRPACEMPQSRHSPLVLPLPKGGPSGVKWGEHSLFTAGKQSEAAAGTDRAAREYPQMPSAKPEYMAAGRGADRAARGHESLCRKKRRAPAGNPPCTVNTADAAACGA